jgi:hypothetical protein
MLVALSRKPALLSPEEARQAWEWFLPNLMPTLTLVGAAAYAGKATYTREGEGETILFSLCLAVSLLYLFLVADALLSLQASTATIEDLRRSNLWLGPLQALATSLLGYFFIKPVTEPTKPD